jgi:glycosyltransferase involved in cell wall biosynthesis
MKNIGIFLAYAPEQSIKSHGISRLLSFILQGMQQNNNINVVIATPAWFEKPITEFMEEQHLDVSKIELLTTNGIPYLLRIKNLLSRKKTTKLVVDNPKKNGTVSSLVKRAKNFMFNIVMHWISIASTPVFILVSMLYFVLSILLIPVILLALISYIIFKLVRKSYRIIQLRIAKRAYNKSRSWLLKNRFAQSIKNHLVELKNNMFARQMYLEMRSRELHKLIRLINKRPDIPVWFVPTLFWPEIKAIKAKIIVAAPDIVFVDFPTHFSDANSAITYNNITKTIAAADHFICYSEYVKQKHLIQSFGVDADKVTVIPHGSIDLSHSFTRSAAKQTGLIQRDQSMQILHTYQKRMLQAHPYLANYNLSEMRFLFYSSQVRPYKNFLGLIQAYEILLRERFVNIKLIVTGDIKSDPNLYNYIINKRLQFDIISLYDVPGEVLTALNHLAVCAVNPTLFEGGFPFTFTEAYSVGTPSVMSNIPMVKAEIDDPELCKQMLFDPYDLTDMVNKIEWAVKNHEELFKLQAPLYQKFKQRNWNLVADEYINLLSDFTVQSCITN